MRLFLTFANFVEHHWSMPTREGAILAHAGFLLGNSMGKVEAMPGAPEN